MVDSIGPRKMGPIQKIKRAVSEDDKAKKSKQDRHDTEEDSSDLAHREGRKGVRVDDRA